MGSIDGGESWDHLGLPDGEIIWLRIAPPVKGGRTIFVGGRDVNGTGSSMISRSTDGGATWTRVLETPAQRSSSPEPLRLSPGFADDGRAFVIDQGVLYGSQDFGETWAVVSLLDGQRVQQLEFSPAFATDRTIVVAVVTGTFALPWAQGDRRDAQPHETSAGVVISRDGGETWQVSSTGLAIDGNAYRYVQQVAVSPSFEQDGLLFAFAWGRGTPDATPAALFRSADRGQTWLPVWQTPEPPIWQRPEGNENLTLRAGFAWSPGFGKDGIGHVILYGLTSWNIGPHNSRPFCVLNSTTDAGHTWGISAAQSSTAPGCYGLQMAPGGPLGHLSYSVTYPGEGLSEIVHRSFDDGKTWEFITPPTLNVPGAISSIAPDGSCMIGTFDGIWMLPPPASPSIQP